MSYLGHTEFGLDHKHWFEPQNFNDTQSINYWMEQWLMFYNFCIKIIQMIICVYL